MALISGSVGHNGAKGCQKACHLPGRRYEGKPTYYPLLKKPYDYTTKNADHADIHLSDWDADYSQKCYNTMIHGLIAAKSKKEYDLKH